MPSRDRQAHQCKHPSQQRPCGPFASFLGLRTGVPTSFLLHPRRTCCSSRSHFAFLCRTRLDRACVIHLICVRSSGRCKTADRTDHHVACMCMARNLDRHLLAWLLAYASLCGALIGAYVVCSWVVRATSWAFREGPCVYISDRLTP